MRRKSPSCNGMVTSGSPASTARGARSSGRWRTSSWPAGSSSTASRGSLRRLCPRVPARVLLQESILLSELPRQAPRRLDAVAGHHAPGARAAPAGGAHDPEAAARVLPVSPPPARRDRARRHPDGHHGDPHAHRRARGSRSASSRVCRRTAPVPTGIRTSISSSPTAGSGPTGRSSRGRSTTRRG